MASILQQFMQSQTTINNQTSQAINDIRNNLTKLNTTLSAQEKGKFPFQPQPNPQVQISAIESSSSSEANVRTWKAVITLRSGKEVETLGNEAGKKGESSISNAQGKNSNVDVSLEPKVTPPAPFPQRLVPLHKDKHHAEILDIFKQVRINIPLLDAIEKIPTYAKFLKDLCTVKRRLNVKKKAFLTEQVSAIIQSNTPPKYKDPGSPTIACVIGSSKIGQALLDLGSSVNLLPYNTYEQLGLRELKPTSIILQLADRSINKPRGVVEDVLVQVDKFYYPVDFVVLDVQLTPHSIFQTPVILGRPFLATSNALINCRSGILKLTFGNMTLELNVFNTCRQPQDLKELQEVNCLESLLAEEFFLEQESQMELVLPGTLENSELLDTNAVNSGAGSKMDSLWQLKFEDLPLQSIHQQPSDEVPPSPVLKPLPESLKYVFLGPTNTFPCIISSSLSVEQEEQLLRVLKQHKGALGWSIADIKGISPTICTHRIFLEENSSPTREMQRRLNPTMKEVVKNEVLKLLDVGIIYPISDSQWVSPTQVVPKKSGVTIVKNEKDELILTRTITGWRMCIDFRKLNVVTRKDHFPLPFLDQTLERVAGHSFYCFLDGFWGYYQIEISPEDQEKTTFTCPFGTFAFRKMPFGLCNAPATFQRCMLSIFSDMVEHILEVFMDDFSVYGDSFDSCLTHLTAVLA
ncbi:uncharacterized protein LOC122298937 [Carya illinoinensis]|uniref:uncharacterized protein LOC122298937 n=1 Tax=Carya illinoinensis TaxID=32201 RepID=UPI001C71D0D6|nr:uncharacterized protein LOC122298937 [Carya illinoinensis]